MRKVVALPPYPLRPLFRSYLCFLFMPRAFYSNVLSIIFECDARECAAETRASAESIVACLKTEKDEAKMNGKSRQCMAV